MALTAEQKEAIMAARGESERTGKQAAIKTRQPIVDGRLLIMTNMGNMSEAEAGAFCIDKFGRDRFGGFA